MSTEEKCFEIYEQLVDYCFYTWKHSDASNASKMMHTMIDARDSLESYFDEAIPDANHFVNLHMLEGIHNEVVRDINAFIDSFLMDSVDDTLGASRFGVIELALSSELLQLIKKHYSVTVLRYGRVK